MLKLKLTKMKKIFVSLSFLLMSVFVFAQGGGTLQKGAEITFEKDVHDFSNLKQGGDASTEFKFTNTGTEPLLISDAKGSCGCTVPEWPKEPIAPGKSSVIKVKYDSKRVGPINKSVTITSNATNEPSKTIRIKGNIDAAPVENTTPLKENSMGAPVENK